MQTARDLLCSRRKIQRQQFHAQAAQGRHTGFGIAGGDLQCPRRLTVPAKKAEQAPQGQRGLRRFAAGGAGFADRSFLELPGFEKVPGLLQKIGGGQQASRALVERGRLQIEAGARLQPGGHLVMASAG